jgi:hypothetical protein
MLFKLRIGATVLLISLALGGCVRPAPVAAVLAGAETPLPAVETRPTDGEVTPALEGETPTQVVQTPTLQLTPTLLPLPVAPPLRARYVLEATLDYARHSLAVEEGVTYVNTTPDRLLAIALVVEPRNYPGAFRLTGLRWEDGSRITNYAWRKAQLSLLLPQPLEVGQSLVFYLSYELKLPYTPRLVNTRPLPFGYTDIQANLGDWYAFIPPYQPGKGFLIHDKTFYGEHLVYDIADFEVTLRLPGLQSNLVVAASAPAEREGEVVRYHHQAARSFAWSVSPFYEVLTQTVQTAAGQTLLESYFFPAYEKAAKSLLQTMAQALPVYEQLFGAMPPRGLTAVQADFLDGMEYDGLFFLSKDFYDWHKGGEADFLVALAAHEIAHQWWLELVGSDQALEPWLDEALCTYSERLYYEHVAPEALNWWWAYRVNYFEPQGWVNISIYDVPDLYGKYRVYRDPVYLRGALFLEELRLQMGDDAFFEALRAYIQRYAYGLADGEGFFEVMRQHTAVDLEPLLSKYFAK